MRVLILDDNEAWRRVLSRLLSGHNCECVMAANVEEALDALEQAETRNAPFQLMTLDHNMPEFNGYQALDLIQDFLEKNQRDMVFVVISGDVTPQDVRDYLRIRGVYDCIVKGQTPSMRKDLADIVDQVMAGKALSFAALTNRQFEPRPAAPETSGGIIINAEVVNFGGDAVAHDKVKAG